MYLLTSKICETHASSTFRLLTDTYMYNMECGAGVAVDFVSDIF